MRTALKRLAARLPPHWQQALKRRHFARQIRRGTFRTGEPEWALLPALVRPGDWAVDVGANVGHYTLELARLVGPAGRVVAFEPVPATFELLAANAARLPHPNVTLVNAAASDAAGVVGMSVPTFATGLPNAYEAAVTAGGGLSVLALPVDALGLPPVALVKIDAEGHELAVLRGMAGLLRAGPVLVVEDNDPAVPAFLAGLGYAAGPPAPGSPNRVYRAVTSP